MFEKQATKRAINNHTEARENQLTSSAGATGLSPAAGTSAAAGASAAGAAATKTSGGIGTGTSAIGSATETREGKKGGLCSDLSGHERKTGRLQVWRSNKYSAQYPWVLRWSLEKKRVDLCIARGPFGAITSMKIVEGYGVL